MSDNLTLTLSIPPTFITKIAQEYGQIKQTENKVLVQDLSGWLDKFITSAFACSTKPSENKEEGTTTSEEANTGATGSSETEESANPSPPPPGSAFKKLCEHLFEQPGSHMDISKFVDPNLYKEYGGDLDRMADILSTFCGVTSSSANTGSTGTNQ